MVLFSCGSLLEWWSNAVMKGLIQFEFGAFAFFNTPILQNCLSSLIKVSWAGLRTGLEVMGSLRPCFWRVLRPALRHELSDRIRRKPISANSRDGGRMKRTDLYKEAGVDLDAANELVTRIKPLVKPTLHASVITGHMARSSRISNPCVWSDFISSSRQQGSFTCLRVFKCDKP